MSRQFADRIDWIGIIHKHKTAHNGIKRFTELHIGGIPV